MGGPSFIQKNRPDWAAEWIEHVSFGDNEKVDYILANEEASLVWLANLACVEFHQMHCRHARYDRPDYIVFDLDPPEGYPFRRLTEIALQLREQLESLGYNAFVKTSGVKGLHLLAPIEPRWSFERVFEAAGAVARTFVAAQGETTLHLKKEARRGKVLIDIYRNRPAQTIVAPYSVRALAGAPVSMPLPWEQLGSLHDLARFNLRTVLDRLLHEGDAWEAMGAYATKLHTERSTPGKRSGPRSNVATPLKPYADKRRFEKTPEPLPVRVAGEGDAFVIHRHHAYKTVRHIFQRVVELCSSTLLVKELSAPAGLTAFSLNLDSMAMTARIRSGRRLCFSPVWTASATMLSRREKLGVSCGVKVPVGQGLATHPYRVLRLWRSRRRGEQSRRSVDRASCRP